MNSEVLVPGLEFAKEYDLTQREITVLVPFLKQPYTAAELAEVLKANKTTLHHTIQRLKLKRLLVLKNRDSKGTNLYEFKLKE